MSKKLPILCVISSTRTIFCMWQFLFVTYKLTRQFFSKYNCHIKFDQFCSSTQTNKNFHIKIARVDRALKYHYQGAHYRSVQRFLKLSPIRGGSRPRRTWFEPRSDFSLFEKLWKWRFQALISNIFRRGITSDHPIRFGWVKGQPWWDFQAGYDMLGLFRSGITGTLGLFCLVRTIHLQLATRTPSEIYSTEFNAS